MNSSSACHPDRAQLRGAAAAQVLEGHLEAVLALAVGETHLVSPLPTRARAP